MRRLELNAVLRAVEEMSWSQRKELIERLQAVQGTEDSLFSTA